MTYFSLKRLLSLSAFVDHFLIWNVGSIAFNMFYVIYVVECHNITYMNLISCKLSSIFCIASINTAQIAYHDQTSLIKFVVVTSMIFMVVFYYELLKYYNRFVNNLSFIMLPRLLYQQLHTDANKKLKWRCFYQQNAKVKGHNRGLFLL